LKLLAFRIGLTHAEFARLAPGQFWDRVEGFEYRRETQLRDLAGIFLSVIGAHTKGRITLDKIVPPVIGRRLAKRRGKVWFRSEHEETFVEHAIESGFKPETLARMGIGVEDA
jgi:hypothetical protein